MNIINVIYNKFNQNSNSNIEENYYKYNSNSNSNIEVTNLISTLIKTTTTTTTTTAMKCCCIFSSPTNKSINKCIKDNWNEMSWGVK